MGLWRSSLSRGFIFHLFRLSAPKIRTMGQCEQTSLAKSRAAPGPRDHDTVLGLVLVHSDLTINFQIETTIFGATSPLAALTNASNASSIASATERKVR